MAGTHASPFTPLSIGKTDTGDFSSWLGRPVEIGNETYTMVTCGAAIASGSNGKQLVTALTTGAPTYIVSLATGIADPLVCGMIPSTLTGPIVSGVNFLAVRDSDFHVAVVRPLVSGGTGSVAISTLLMTGSGADLIAVFTAATTTSALWSDVLNVRNAPGLSLEANTAVAAVSGAVSYHAPFRAAL
jgi:hypothetical protein